MGIKHADPKTTGTKITEAVYGANHIIDGDVLPNATNTHDLGNASYIFAEGWFNKLRYVDYISVDAGGKFIIEDSSGNDRIVCSDINTADPAFTPNTTNTGVLGVANFAWKEIHAYNAVSATQTTGLSFKWKDTSEQALATLNQASSVSWTDLDLTAFTSANAKMAYLQLFIDADVIGAGDQSYLRVRKNGTSPTHYPKLVLDKAAVTVDVLHAQCAAVGLDSGQLIEYDFICGTGWTCDYYIAVLGYWE